MNHDASPAQPILRDGPQTIKFPLDPRELVESCFTALDRLPLVVGQSFCAMRQIRGGRSAVVGRHFL